MKRIVKIALIVSGFLLSTLIIFVVIVFNRPGLMPPGQYHPRALFSELLGYKVHPWIKVDPARRYTLQVWGTRWPIFPDGRGYDDLMEEVIMKFRKTYPNVHIEYVLLPLGDIERAIEMAVENSTPPDVCITTFDPSLIGSGLVVPINMFLCGKPKDDIEATPVADFEPSSLKSVSIHNRLWAWPSWTEVKSWAGNAELLRLVGIDVERIMLYGWSYEDVLAMVNAFKVYGEGVEERYRKYGIVLDTTSTHTIDTLMEAGGKGLILSDDNELLWQGEVLRSGLSLLKRIKDAKGFPEPVHTMGEKMLELFWGGRAAVIGPVGPGFLKHVYERQARLDKGDLPSGGYPVEPILLPVPHPPGCPKSPCISLHTAIVFTCPGEGRFDTAYLAVKFGEMLAREEALWLAGGLPIVPALIRDRRHWLSLGGIPDGACRRFLISSSTSGIMVRNTSLLTKKKERLLRKEIINPMMRDFWGGVISPEEFDQRLSAYFQENRHLYPYLNKLSD
ncbi:MAG: hypothetical protein GX969_01390 [Firmicutes bacterium]|nr:hypothetical protein [Bacillota bacterium]